MVYRQYFRCDVEGKCGCCQGNDICFFLKDGENFENYLSQNQMKAVLPERYRLGWHGVLCLLSTFSLRFTFSMSSEKSKYFIFMTNWGQILAFITYTLQLCLTYIYQGQQKPSCLNKRMKILWFLLNSNAALSLLVTFSYWVFIVPKLPTILVSDASPNDSFTGYKLHVIWLDRFLGHGLIPILVCLNLVFSSTRPWRYRQCLTPVLFGLSWVLFSYIYYLMGGTGYVKHVKLTDEKAIANGGYHFIYKVIDWEKTLTLAYLALMIGGLMIFHIMLCFVASLVNKYLRTPIDNKVCQIGNGTRDEGHNLMMEP